jgi:hypothetical protein
MHMDGESRCSPSMIGCQLFVATSMSGHVRTCKPPGGAIDAHELHTANAKHIWRASPSFAMRAHACCVRLSRRLATARQ